jgi:hypothetical protein
MDMIPMVWYGQLHKWYELSDLLQLQNLSWTPIFDHTHSRLQILIAKVNNEKINKFIGKGSQDGL